VSRTAGARHTWLDKARIASRLTYLMILLVATLTPFVPDGSSAGVAFRLHRAIHPELGGGDVIDGARNLVLFAGWGAVWALTASASIRRVMIEGTLTGLAVSGSVEFIQLFSSNRVASIVDVATNTGGALAGTLGLLLLAALAQERRGARSFVGLPTLFFGGSYGVAAWLEAVIPLFRSDGPGPTGGLAARISGALAAFTPRSLFEIPWMDFLIFVPAGALAVAALIEHGQKYSVARSRVIVAGIGLAGLAELLHAPIGGQIVLGSILLHAAATGFGAWAAARWLPGLTIALRGPARPRALAMLYVAVLTCWAWRPYLPEYQLSSILQKFQGNWYVPLAALGMRRDLFTVVDVCAPFFLYLPLGGLLSVWPWRRSGPWSGPWPGVWLALLLELSQAVVLDRMPDITDFLVTASGVLVGWAILRRAGYRQYGEMAPAS
jgi:VanZ family protein